MKTLSGIILLFLACIQLGNAQCTVNLGDDIHVCTSIETGFPPTTLGEQLQITNAAAPYSYEWSIAPITYFSATLYAFNFLNDTSIANPTAAGVLEDSLTFFLRLEDASQQVCYDTIIVSASMFGTHLGTLSFYINAGDSVLLFGGPNVVSNYPTDSLVWRPSIGLNDSTISQPMASPPTSQNYHCVIWDSQGCIQAGSPFQYVSVSPVGIIEESSKTSVQVYANNYELVLNANQEILPYTFELWDAQGRLARSQTVAHSTARISTNGLEAGVYLYSIRTEKQLLESGKLLLQ